MEAAHLEEWPAGVMAKQIVLSSWAKEKKIAIDFGLRVVSAFCTILIMAWELLFWALASHTLMWKTAEIQGLAEIFWGDPQGSPVFGFPAGKRGLSIRNILSTAT